MAAVLRNSKEIRLQISDSGRCSPATLSRASLLGSTESIRRSLQMEMDSIRAEQSQLGETVGRTLSSYRSLKADLKGDLEWLSTQQERLDEASSEVEPLTVLVMGSWGALEKMKGSKDDAREYTKRKDELNKKLLILKIQVVCVKLAHISLLINQLQELASIDPRMQTPAEILFGSYEEWIENNQQIFQLQSKMLEIEADKVRLYKEFCVQHRARAQTATSKHSFTSQLEMQFGRDPEVELTQRRLQEMIGEDADTAHITYLDNILRINETSLSFEACKLKSYIRECWDVHVIDDSFPTGVHPDRYQEFVGSLCQYIVDKHSVGRRRLTYDIVYARLEHHLLPAVSPLLTKYISQSDEDKRIKQLCYNLRYVTQPQLGVEPKCQDMSVAPYYAAVTALKGVSLSITPTKKTYNVVKAAQTVFKTLNERAVKDGRGPPGADEFMDVWVYVVLKAAIPNLASTVALLKKYSNPGLAFSEAGYYLASVEFATQYILRLNELDFTSDQGLFASNLVVCEHSKFARLAAQENAVVDLVSSSVWLEGYQLFAVKEWQLNPTRLNSSILVPVGDREARVKVTIVKLTPQGQGRTAQNRLLEKCFLTPELLHPGLSCTQTPLGLAVTADLRKVIETLTLMHLPNGDYDEFAPLIYRYCGLERLCLTSDKDSLSREYQVQGNILVAKAEVEAGTPVDDDIQSGYKQKKVHSPDFELQATEKLFCYLSLDWIHREVARGVQRLCSIYGLSRHRQNALEHLINSTSSMLQDLGYFSVLSETDGIYSDLLMKAVQCFQSDYNSRLPDASEDHKRLVESGCVTVPTWRALQDSLKRVVAKLHHLGFVYSGDALSRDPAEHRRFRQFVSDCQTALNINVVFQGTIGKITLAEIDSRLNESSWS